MPEQEPVPCLHEDSVQWNPWHRTVQCHRCGQVMVDVVALEAAETTGKAAVQFINSEVMPRYVELLEWADIPADQSVVVEMAKELLATDTARAWLADGEE